MKIQAISTIIAAILLSAGCSKKNTTSGTPQSAAKEQMSAASSSPVSQAAMAAWQQGDKPTAISTFLAADWNARPLFASDSVLSLTEGQFKSLSDTERKLKSAEMMKQIDSLKQLAAAAAQSGREAAAKGDTTQAQKCFTSLKQFGMALSGPECLSLVQIVGKGFARMADTELAKMSK